MAEFTSVGYGIGEALNRIAENLTERRRLQFQERERQADRYEQQARDIAQNIAQLGGKDVPEAKPYVDQLQEIVSKHNALYPREETPALLERIKRFLGRSKRPLGQSVAVPESIPAKEVTTPSELLPAQLDVGGGEGETVALTFPPQRSFLPEQRLLPRTMEVAPPGTPPPLQWLSPEQLIAASPRRSNAILQELQDLRQAFKAGGQSEEQAGANAIKAIQNRYGVNIPGKPPRIERDPITRNVISITDESSGNIYDATTINSAPQNVQQAWDAAQRGQMERPPEAAPSVKTEFELFLKQYPTATVEDWAEFKAKEARKGKTRKEQITEEIANAFEKGDRSAVRRLQSELMAIDPAGAERLQFAAENIDLREAASIARQEAAKEKRVAPFRGIVETAANAHRLKEMGDAGNAAADVDLTLEFFKVIRGAEGTGIRFSRNEQDFITGARPLSESLEVRGNQVFSGGQPLAREQRQRMIDVIDTHARAAERMMNEIESQEPITPQSLKNKAKPKPTAPTPARAPGSEKESILNEGNQAQPR